jgi:uncharacterized damage-inducible protein DinB
MPSEGRGILSPVRLPVPPLQRISGQGSYDSEYIRQPGLFGYHIFMEQAMAPDLRYPIGKFPRPVALSAAEREQCIAAIAAAPGHLRDAVAGLDDSQLDAPYRPGGWTVRQVVHHLPDSHMNSYVRFKLALTEDTPTIKPYHEDRWAEIEEARMAPIGISLDLLDALHRRWTAMLRNMTDADFARMFLHPDLGPMPLWTNVALYAWHGRHHVAQITSLRERMGW